MNRISIFVGTLAVALSTMLVSAQETTFSLSPEIATLIVGDYVLDKPSSTGAQELTIERRGNWLRLMMGTAANLMAAEGMAKESIDGKLSADVYRFTVSNRPGVSLKFAVSKGQVVRVVYAEDSSQPAILATGKKKTMKPSS